MSFFVRASMFIGCDTFSQCFIFLSVFENAASGENEWVGISSFPTMNLKEKKKQNRNYINNSKKVIKSIISLSFRQAWSYPQVCKRKRILYSYQTLYLWKGDSTNMYLNFR